MAVALRGNLSDFGIGEVFQLIGQQHKTGILEVDGSSSERIHVAFVEGCVVRAAVVGPHDDAALGDMLVRSGLLSAEQLVALERRVESEDDSFRRLAIQEAGLAARDVDNVEDLVTRETLFRLMRWGKGSFHFSAQKVRTQRPEMRGWPAEQILMDGLRMVDEWRTFEPESVRDDGVFRPIAAFDVYRDSVRGESARQLADAQRLFDLVDGVSPVRRIVDQARIGSFEGARLLSALRRAGAIEPLAAAELPKTPRSAAGPAAGPRVWLRAPLAALPFVALALVAWFAQHPPAPAAPGLRADPLVAARAASQTLRLRNAAEAYRFAEGRWPGGLEELRGGGWQAAAMARETASPYPVLDSGAGLSVLAPEY